MNPEAVSLVNIMDLITRLATSHGIDTEGLIKDQETLQAEKEQAQADQAGDAAVQQGMGPAIQGAIDGVKDGTVTPEQIQQTVQNYQGDN